MIDKKRILPEAIALLSAIMRTCPATPLNGGDHARKHLELLCENGVEVSGCELRAGVRLPDGCECEGGVDIYSHLLSYIKTDTVSRSDIASYFASHVHANKILGEAIEHFSNDRSLRIVYGHLLVPVTIIDVKIGMVVDRNSITSFGVLKFPDGKFSNGDIVVMHYGFLVEKISLEEAEFISKCNNESPLFGDIRRVLQGNMNFREMHYYPRSLRIAAEQ